MSFGSLRLSLLFFSGRRAQVERTRSSTPSVSGAVEGREVRARGRQPMRMWSQVGREKWAGPPSIHPRELRVRVRDLSLFLYILENHLKNLKIPVSIIFFVDNGLFIS